MQMINKFILFIVFIVIGLYFVWVSQNWKNPKLMEVLPILVGVLITITWSIISVPQTIKGNFTHQYFTDFDGKQSLNFMRHPVLRNIFRIHTDISGYIEKDQVDFNLKSNEESVEFLSFVILSSIAETFASKWYYKEDTPDDIELIELDRLPVSIINSKYYHNLKHSSPFKKIALPQNTKIEFYPPSSFSGSFAPRAEIHLKKNTFFNLFKDFHIKISIYYSRGTIGLNEIGRYVGVVSPGKRAIDLNDDEIRKYWSTQLDVTYEASFGRFRPWSKEVLIYKKWIKEYFEGIKDSFDWVIQDQKIRDYLQVTSYEKIIHQMK